MPLQIISATNGIYTFVKPHGYDRLSLIAENKDGEGTIYLVPQEVPAKGATKDKKELRFLIDLRNSTLPALVKVVASCRATACGPADTWYAGRPRMGRIGNLEFTVTHKRHADGQSKFVIPDVTVREIALTNVAGTQSTHEAHQYF